VSTISMRYDTITFFYRNAARRRSLSGNKSRRGTSDDYVRPAENRPQPEPQYDVIQLDHTQHAAAAAVNYDTLNPTTLGQPHLYDVLARRQTTDDNAADYVNLAQCKN